MMGSACFASSLAHNVSVVNSSLVLSGNIPPIQQPSATQIRAGARSERTVSGLSGFSLRSGTRSFHRSPPAHTWPESRTPPSWLSGRDFEAPHAPRTHLGTASTQPNQT